MPSRAAVRMPPRWALPPTTRRLHCAPALCFLPLVQADTEQGCLECIAWLAECGAEVTSGDGPPGEAALDCKASAGQLKMPEEKAKVAHGDENLRLEDFLKTFS